jgi:hypothetical protein
MSDDRGHLRSMRLLPFAAAADKAYLTFKRQQRLNRPLGRLVDVLEAE